MDVFPSNFSFLSIADIALKLKKSRFFWKKIERKDLQSLKFN